MGVGGGLIEAVGDDGLAGGVDEADLFDAGTGYGFAVFADLFGRAFDAEDAAALGVVGPSGQALGCAALPCYADPGEHGRMRWVFKVVVTLDSAGQVDADEGGQKIAWVASVTLGRVAPIGIAKSPDRALNVGDAIEVVGVAFGGVAQDQAAPLRVGDFDERARKVAGEADEFAAGGADFGEPALGVEA